MQRAPGLRRVSQTLSERGRIIVPGTARRVILAAVARARWSSCVAVPDPSTMAATLRGHGAACRD